MTKGFLIKLAIILGMSLIFLFAAIQFQHSMIEDNKRNFPPQAFIDACNTTISAEYTTGFFGDSITLQCDDLDTEKLR